MIDQIRVSEYSNEMMIATHCNFSSCSDFIVCELLIDSRHPLFFLYSSGPSPPTYTENKTGYVYTTPSSRTYLPPVVGSSRQAKNSYTGALPKKLWRSSASCRIQCVSSSNEFQLTRKTKKWIIFELEKQAQNAIFWVNFYVNRSNLLLLIEMK